MQYACRKTLADSRPRVRGRFAKNDDFGEAHRTSGGHHEEDDEEDVRSLSIPYNLFFFSSIRFVYYIVLFFPVLHQVLNHSTSLSTFCLPLTCGMQPY